MKGKERGGQKGEGSKRRDEKRLEQSRENRR